MIIEDEAYLEHFGVKGMKWGVRNQKKSPASKGKQTRAKRALNKFLDDADIPGRPNRRSNRMTDEEKRKENSGKAKAGKIFVATFLSVNGARQIRNTWKD